MLLFDAASEHPCAGGLDLHLVTDRVMGGLSEGRLKLEQVAGRPALRMTGDVRLDNDGGFIQMAGELPSSARSARGLRLEVFGNDEVYGCHLRTEDLTRPWQSYRRSFQAPAKWHRIELDYQDFEAYRTDRPFRRAALRRMGLIGVGRAFRADLAIAGIELLLD
ncbi:MAG: CIA30 family protein [Myxococcota bacterium]